MNVILTRSSSADNLIQLIGALAIFVVMLFAIWLVLRWMGNFQKQQMSTRNLRLLETIRVGNNKMVSVIRAGRTCYVVAIGKDEVHLLGELSEEQAALFLQAESDTAGDSADSFGQLLARLKGRELKKQDK